MNAEKNTRLTDDGNVPGYQVTSVPYKYSVDRDRRIYTAVELVQISWTNNRNIFCRSVLNKMVATNGFIHIGGGGHIQLDVFITVHLGRTNGKLYQILFTVLGFIKRSYEIELNVISNTEHGKQLLVVAPIFFF